MNDKTIITLFGLLMVTILELYALSLGHNGVILTSVIGLIGITIPRPKILGGSG